MCSPCMRGWSYKITCRSYRDWVFPVYAGVIPILGVVSVPKDGVPRVCGGDPVLAPLRSSLDECSPCMRGWSSVPSYHSGTDTVFPVYAGVIPSRSAPIGSSSGVPRVCGGDPKLNPFFSGHFLCSPCMRGWSGCTPRQAVTYIVFPVYAGVILTFTSWEN